MARARRDAPAGSDDREERDDGDIPIPPWQRRPRSPGRAHLTRDAIVDAAIRVLDAVGMEKLSMRRVGEELGTGAGSLYWHVRNKEELFQLIFERVTGHLVLPDPDPDRWKEQLRELAHQMRAMLKSHRDVARLSLGRVPTGPGFARYSEWLFQLLEPVGVPDRVIAYLGDLFGLYVGAYAFEESLGFHSPTGEDLSPEQITSLLRDYALSLPADRFPRTRAAVDLLFGGGPDERYEFGVDVLLRGVETFARTAPGKTRRADR